MRGREPDASRPERKDPVVFWILRPSRCGECGDPLESGELLSMECGKPLCMECADLDFLTYLPKGDAALTRRASKYSTLSAVVVRFSRARRRYERQGILVEQAALERAEEECLSDAARRAARQERDEHRREQQDRELEQRMKAAIRELFPGCPPDEAGAIARRATVRGSGRVGRTAGGKALEEGALTAAVVAAIRHVHTRYDELLMRGWNRSAARGEVREKVERVLERWRTPQRARNASPGAHVPGVREPEAG